MQVKPGGTASPQKYHHTEIRHDSDFYTERPMLRDRAKWKREREKRVVEIGSQLVVLNVAITSFTATSCMYVEQMWLITNDVCGVDSYRTGRGRRQKASQGLKRLNTPPKSATVSTPRVSSDSSLRTTVHCTFPTTPTSQRSQTNPRSCNKAPPRPWLTSLQPLASIVIAQRTTQLPIHLRATSPHLPLFANKSPQAVPFALAQKPRPIQGFHERVSILARKTNSFDSLPTHRTEKQQTNPK